MKTDFHFFQKTKLPVLILLLGFFTINLSSQSILEIKNKEIKCGDSIIVQFSNQFPGSLVKIINPIGKEFIVEPEKSEAGYKTVFVSDDTKGFLTQDWNKYSIYLLNKNKVIDSTFVRLANAEKTLYFTIFIDDVGPYGFINEEDYKWFKSKGGKFNIGYMHDDFGMQNLNFVSKKYNDTSDFIFHHFHAQRFSGNSFLLKIYQFTQWKNFKTSVSEKLNYELRDRHFLIFSFILSFLLLIGIFIFSRKKNIRIWGLIILLLMNVVLFGIIYTYSYVIDVDKKEVMLADTDWCKTFLENTKSEFEQNGMNYPQITRHGWTVPPRGLGDFYLLEMGVMADQSLDYKPFPGMDIYSEDNGEELNQVFEYHIYNWPEGLKQPIPFYTNINGDINQLWDGNEARRGIIEIPSTHGPYATKPYDEKSLKICDSLPNGALVSCWGHPGKKMENAKPLLDYVEKNFQIRHVNVKEYLDVYLANNPRPVLIDSENKHAYWAYVSDLELRKIVDCELVSFEDSGTNYHFKNLPPILIFTTISDTSGISSNYDFERKTGDYSVFKLKK